MGPADPPCWQKTLFSLRRSPCTKTHQTVHQKAKAPWSFPRWQRAAGKLPWSRDPAASPGALSTLSDRQRRALVNSMALASDGQTGFKSRPLRFLA